MNRCLTLFGYNMGNAASRRSLLLRFRWPRRTIAATLASCVTCVLLLAGSVYALDPNKRLTQYSHTSWRIQDGSAPSGIEAIAQTSDGYLWFSSDSQGMYRFDGVRFLPWTLASNGETINKIVNVYGDHAGGLWALGEREIAHLKGGVVTSHFNLDGLVEGVVRRVPVEGNARERRRMNCDRYCVRGAPYGPKAVAESRGRNGQLSGRL